jgi:hypothetical protein
MNTDRLLILGGYGTTGRLIARLLLEQTDCRLVLAGRNLARAETAAQALNTAFAGQRVTAIAADAADVDSLRRAMRDCRMAVIASSTSEFVDNVTRAALDAQVDYLDVQYSSAKLAALRKWEPDIRAAGRCFITDGGFHPGLPAALVRHIAGRFDRLLRADVGSVIKIDWRTLDLGPATTEELVRELAGYQALECRAGVWQRASMRSMWLPHTMDFGRGFGRQYCAPMFLEEMRALPELCAGLQETGFYVGGFNWFVDWLVMPAALVAMRLAPRRALSPVARLMYWALRRFSKPPYGTLLKLEAAGECDGRIETASMTLSHADGYWFTAIPVVACLLQVLDADSGARQPGLWFQAHIVEPGRLLRDMQRMGIEITGRV